MSLNIKKIATSKVLTEQVFEKRLDQKLKQALKPYVTKKDLKQALKPYATKKYLSNELLKYNSAIAKDLLIASQERAQLRHDLKTGIEKLSRERLHDMSLLMEELKTIREEIATFGYRQAKHSQKIAKLSSHEARIIKIETHLKFPAYHQV